MMIINILKFREALEDNYILLLTSNSVEKDAIRKTLNLKTKANALSHKFSDTFHLGEVNQRFAIHLSGESGGSREKSIGRICRNFLMIEGVPKPSLIVLVGFCWGIPNKTCEGDVILADTVLSLNRQEATNEGHTYHSISMNNALTLNVEIARLLNSYRPKEGGSVIRGEMASTETLFTSDAARDKLLSQHPGILGGEMEAYDFLPDCKNIPWLILKAVSDFGGDGYDRDKQSISAVGAAKLVPELIRLLEENEQISNPINNPSVDDLSAIIEGEKIRVQADDVRAEELNDYLNDIIGPKIIRRLKQYSPSLDLGNQFPPKFGGLILEVMQNSLRHGSANYVEVAFYGSKILVVDDGKSFDLNDISGDRGGARAWKKLIAEFMQDDSIKHKWKYCKNNPCGNKNTFRVRTH